MYPAYNPTTAAMATWKTARTSELLLN